MAHPLMAWVWIILTLDQFNSAESQRDALGRLDGQNEPYDGNDQATEGTPVDWANRIISVPVWSFLRGEPCCSCAFFVKPVEKIQAVKQFYNTDKRYKGKGENKTTTDKQVTSQPHRPVFMFHEQC